LHRHAAVRADLAGQPSLALRVMVAHAIVGSPLWNVRVEAQRAASDAIAESVENCASEAVFDEKRRAILALLGFDPETPTVSGGFGGEHGIAGLLVRLIELPDPQVLDILAIVMAETLEAGSQLIELLGPLVGTDMSKVWQADDALLDLIRDREVLGHVLADVAGAQVSNANEAETGKVKRRIICDCLTGENGRARVEGWVPKWMAFPPAAYTERGGVVTVSRATRLADLGMSAPSQPEPLRQAA
jgi:ParB family chromosome partitioning protein